MKLKSNIATSENGFIFNPSTGDSFTANALATEIIAALKSGQAPEEIRNGILERYDVEANQLERDWEDLVVQLKDANLLTV
jgi:hypothetical protein